MRKLLLVFITCFVIASSGSYARAAEAENARQFVDSVGKKVLDVLNSNTSKDQKQQDLRRMFSDTVDLDWMGRFVLGNSWNSASADQRTHYLASYREYMLMRYTKDFSDYTDSKYTITGATAQDEGQFVVSMSIKSPNASEQDTQAGYRVHPVGGEFKITDIIIEGVSLITTQRSEFASAVQSGGIDKLIGELDAKTQAGSK